VSAQIDRAEVPLVSRAGRSTQVEGKVVFTDLEFTPGPIADQLFDLLGQDRVPTLKLNQPVTLAINDGRVIQRGLAIPVCRLTQVEIEGSVDFARNLNLTASLPITPAMLGNNPALMGMLGGTRISVPIGGTLARPRIDRDRFSAALLDASKSLLQRAAGGGAVELRRLFDRLLDPALRRASPSRLPREDRRALRQERKMQRELEREP